MHSYFDEKGVLLTERCLAVAGHFFALRDMRGVRIETVGRDRRLPIVLALIGLATLAAGIGFRQPAPMVIGIMLAGVGWLNWKAQDVVHYLWIETPDGPREALGSTDASFVERVAQAVRTALAGRSEPAGEPQHG